MSIVKFNKTTDKIWNNLMEKFGNPVGVAALMGAMYATSALKPNLVNTFGKEHFIRLDNYTSSVMNETRSMESFVHDGYSYGIFQWNWWASKQGLYNMARKAKKSIGSLDLQLDFLWDELHMNEYNDILNQLTTVERMDICETVAYSYAKSRKNKKLEMKAVSTFARQYYDYYVMHMSKDDIETKYTFGRNEKEEEKQKRRVVALANNVTVRIADDCHAKQIGALRTDISYEYIMSNEKKSWHCIVFDGKLRWVSAKNTQVISA